jgi:hypothetical protein
MSTPMAPTQGASVIRAAQTPTINTPSMAAEIADQYTLDDVDPVGRSEVMIYGKPGNGKGVLSATFPPPFRWMAADGKTSLKSLHWAMKKGMTSFTDPKQVVAYSPTEIGKGKYIATARAFNLMSDMIDHWFSPTEVDKWQTLVLDSFTEINTWALDLGLGLNNQLPTSSKPLSRSDTINRQAQVRLITGEQDYKSAMGLIDGFLRNTRVLCARHNKNLVVICHEWQDTYEKDDGTVVVTAVQPLLIGQLRTRIVKDFDDVWFMEKLPGSDGPEITAYLQGTSVAVGKSRWGSIINKMKNPDYRKMIEEVKKFHGQG